MTVSALEGLAAGTPIVTTPVEGMKVLLGDQAAGVISPDMSAAHLAAALTALVEDPAQRARMGRAGRELVASSFALERMLDQYEALYRRR